jgi:hypothetical protein
MNKQEIEQKLPEVKDTDPCWEYREDMKDYGGACKGGKPGDECPACGKIYT